MVVPKLLFPQNAPIAPVPKLGRSYRLSCAPIFPKYTDCTVHWVEAQDSVVPRFYQAEGSVTQCYVKLSSNYEAQANAIIESIFFVSTLFEDQTTVKTNVVIFTDAKSILQAIESENDKDPTIRKLSKTISDCIMKIQYLTQYKVYILFELS